MSKNELIEYMQGLEIIDCHEHLVNEPVRIEKEVDVLTLLSCYTYFDLTSAGRKLKEGENPWQKSLCLDTEVPLEERWEQVWPHLQNIKYGSYYRPVAITLRDIYGIDDLNPDTYKEASARIKANNTPGLYTRILRDKCGIKYSLIQNGLIEGLVPSDILKGVTICWPLHDGTDRNLIKDIHKNAGLEVSDLDTCLAAIANHLEVQRSQGSKGFKIMAHAQVAPDMDAARPAYLEWMNGGPAPKVLQSTFLDTIMKKAEEWDMPVPVHSGIWYDYRHTDPKNMLDIVARYPNVRFDIYHLGMPFVLDCIFIAKNFPNAHLNLCWCYTISQEITRRAILDIIDTVPVNKVFGFGGDFNMDVENVYGHLVMARETIADALSERIAKGHIDMEGAKHIAKLWLQDNPTRFYGLS